MCWSRRAAARRARRHAAIRAGVLFVATKIGVLNAKGGSALMSEKADSVPAIPDKSPMRQTRGQTVGVVPAAGYGRDAPPEYEAAEGKGGIFRGEMWEEDEVFENPFELLDARDMPRRLKRGSFVTSDKGRSYN